MELNQMIENDVMGGLSGGVGGWIVVGMYALAAILVLVGLLKGWSRGMYRSLTRLVTIAGAIALSVFVCLKLYPAFVSLCEGQTLLSLLQRFHLEGVFAGNELAAGAVGGLSGEALALLAALPAAVVVLPVAMILVFMVSSALLLIVHAVICYIFGWNSYCNNILTRAVGAVIGCVQGLVVAVFLFIPVFNGMSYVGVVSAELPSTSPVRGTYETFIRPADESALAHIVRACGGDAVKGACEATLVVEDETVDVEALMRSVGGMVGHAQLLQKADFKDLTEDQVAALRKIIEYAEQSEDACTVLTELMRCAAASLDDYEKKLPFREPFLTTLRDFIAYFEQDLTDAYLVEDLTALTEAYIVLMQSGVLKATDADAVTAALMRADKNGVRPLNAAVTYLTANARTAHLADSVMDFAVAAIAQNAGESASALYDNVSADLRAAVDAVNAEGLSGADYEAALVVAAAEVFAQNNLTADEQGLASMATVIATAHADTDTWSEAVVRDILLSYFHTSAE